MSINAIIGSSFSALHANQRGLEAVSTNVANLNTEGYARLDPSFVFGDGQSVRASIGRAADAFLDAASWRGAAGSAGARVVSEYLDRAQALFGDPSGTGFVFAGLDDIGASLDALALNPSSQVGRDEAVRAIARQFSRLDALGGEVAALRQEVAYGVAGAVAEINSLLDGIARLNPAISAASLSNDEGGQSAHTEQGILIDRLSKLVDMKVQRNELGAVEIRTSSGLTLVGHQASRIFTLESPSAGEPGALVLRQTDSGASIPLRRHLGGGQLSALLNLRDRQLPDLSAAVAGFGSGLADALNAAHNQGSTQPPPSALTGGDTGLLASDALRFTGRTRVGITDAEGRLQRQIMIDFDNGHIVDEASGTVSATGTTIGSLVSGLDAVLGGNGQSRFAGGRLTIAAAGSHGVVVADDADNPARRAGRGFAHSFALNDLIVGGPKSEQATGLAATDAHGFAAGGSVLLGFRDASGAIVSTARYTVSGTSIADLASGLNAVVAGRGRVQFDVGGRLGITPEAGIADVVILDDLTQRGDTELSLTEIFGLPTAASGRSTPGLRADILSRPQRLAVGEARVSGVGTLAVAAGDGAGAARLSAALSSPVGFVSAGGLDGAEESVSGRAARLAGHVGLLARAADSEASYQDAIMSEVTRRRQEQRGVDLDQELVRMTTYQQAYAAASRMMQAAQELYDTLLRIV